MIDRHGWGPGTAGAIDFEAGRRRFTQCILRCEAAITSGALENARIALDEARELIPHAPEIAVLDRRMIERRDGTATSRLPVPSALSLAFEGEDDDTAASDEFAHLNGDVAVTPPTATSFERRRALVLTALPLAVVLVAMSVLGIGLWPISATRSPAAPPQSRREGAVVASPSPTRPAPRTLPDAIVPAGAVATTGALRTLYVDGEAAGDDEEIRIILKRYEKAFNRLSKNDRVASLVSRGAQREVVERTVVAPPSGKLSLGVCDITRAGDVGIATCAGSSPSEATVGASAGTAHRYSWAFELRKDADGWRIEQLKVE